MKQTRAGRVLCWLMASLLAQETTAQNLSPSLKPCGTGKVATVQSGDHITLTDGTIVQLADVKAPEYWPDNTPYKSWPYSYAAKSGLSHLVLEQTISLECHKKTRNTFGDTVAHISLASGIWIQETLLKNGHSMVMPNIASMDITHRLRAAERTARDQHIGLWGMDAYQAINAEQGSLKTGWFQLVRGKIHTATKVRRTIYLNFGEDWRSDFTVQLDQKLEKQFLKQGIEPTSLNNTEIEVRGWVEWSGGPKIILTHPDQLEILSVSETR